jgi:hypothetical protein
MTRRTDTGAVVYKSPNPALDQRIGMRGAVVDIEA